MVECMELHDLLSSHHRVYGEGIREPVSDIPEIKVSKHGLGSPCPCSHNPVNCKVLPKEYRNLNTSHFMYIRLNPWSPGGIFMVQKMDITSPIPVF